MAIVSACEFAPVQLAPGAERVREIHDTGSCRFLRVVEFRKKTGSDDTGRLIAAGHNGVRNLVAQSGGDAYRVVLSAPDWTHGVIVMQAEAYRCE